jgi:hypothetical protein
MGAGTLDQRAQGLVVGVAFDRDLHADLGDPSTYGVFDAEHATDVDVTDDLGGDLRAVDLACCGDAMAARVDER